MLTKEELPECPVATTVALIGSKWKLLIIRNLLQRPWRFNELKKDLCKRQVLFHIFWQLIFHKKRQLIFHTYLVFDTHGVIRGLFVN